ncbi:uncharacterized protein MONBRDRAFT_33149 [Monosiga brevicollis MX1]|uniref:Pentatricopeptide repeat-containing protein-mitochondrial domain-containing protein n=1 Tax=Monosiga brevicollis TaxID=81824 RepID=A9V3Z4_MONBE|nr:uncharacterized protein MONBRDRAFT_33149 [Monosiga brevicollis MX1]EDQ87891.1 predicted protein [Monosiga brevicollis MX1]|eukprot:XP_001747424.1 hypothetical protein [Monosiga brevicollis MX1]
MWRPGVAARVAARRAWLARHRQTVDTLAQPLRQARPRYHRHQSTVAEALRDEDFVSAIRQRAASLTAARPVPVARLQELYARLSVIDMNLALDLRHELESLKVSVPDELHLLAAANIVSNQPDADRLPALERYLEHLNADTRERMVRLAAELLLSNSNTTPSHISSTTAAQFVFLRQKAPALTPDALHGVQPSRRSRQLFELAGSKGTAISDSQQPSIVLQASALVHLVPVFCRHLLRAIKAPEAATDVRWRPLFGLLLRALPYSSPEHAFPLIAEMLRAAVQHDILLMTLAPRELFDMPGVRSDFRADARWMATVAHSLHLCDANFAAPDVDAAIAAAAHACRCETDAALLRPAVNMLLPVGPEIVEYIERLQLAAVAAGSDGKPVDYLVQVAALLLNAVAHRNDYGGVMHLLQLLQRQPADRVQEALWPETHQHVLRCVAEHSPTEAFNLAIGILATSDASALDSLVARLVDAQQPGLVGSLLKSLEQRKIKLNAQRRNAWYCAALEHLPSAQARTQLMEEFVSKLEAGTIAPATVTKIDAALQRHLDPEKQNLRGVGAILEPLNQVLTAASCHAVAETALPVVKQAMTIARKTLSDALTFDRQDQLAVTRALTSLLLSVARHDNTSVKTSSATEASAPAADHGRLAAPMHAYLNLSSRFPEKATGTDVRHRAIAGVLLQLATEGDDSTALLDEVVLTLPHLDVTYRAVANAIADELREKDGATRGVTAYRLHDAFMRHKIRFPAPVHMRFLSMVADSHDIAMVVDAFTRMSEQGITPPRDSYSILTESFAQSGNFTAALKVLDQMRAANSKPNLKIYHCIIRAVSNRRQLDRVQRVLREMESDKLEPDLVTHTLLARKHLKFGQPDKAANIIHNAIQRGQTLSPQAADVWMAAIAASSEDMERQMRDIIAYVKEHRVAVGLDFYTGALRACHNMVEALYREARQNHSAPVWADVEKQASSIVQLGLDTYHDTFTDKLMQPNLRVCNQALALCAAKGDLDSAQRVLHEIRALQLKPDEDTYLHLIEACGQAENFSAMQQAFDEYLEAIEPANLKVFTRMIFHYGRRREIDRAMVVYDRMLEAGLVPDPELNDILVEVCRIDKTEVLLAAARHHEQQQQQQQQQRKGRPRR